MAWGIVSVYARFYDLALAPLVALAAVPMKKARGWPSASIPLTTKVLRRSGVFPIRNHYYEPMFDTTDLKDTSNPRELPGIDFGLRRQTDLLRAFRAADVLRQLPRHSDDPRAYALDNPNFGSGDAEAWFHVIDRFRPRRIVEVGSGHSTKIARLAIEHIRSGSPGYACEHVCIEPFEMPWLEELGVTVLRQKVEDTDLKVFERLRANDVLFIDSSHIIRPQGDVLFEVQRILPILKRGVIVHFHDIFSPRDYPREWIERPLFWNEQYLLEAFLTHNSAWEILLALNMLKHERYDLLAAACPNLAPDREPGSFYIRKL